jgi:pimeloyl-ACP methyl ester carboxylesterase
VKDSLAFEIPDFEKRPGIRNIQGKVHQPEKQLETEGTVVFLHGFKGYMDWGAWDLVGDRFAAAGLRFIRFNFTHNGTSPKHPSDFVDLEAFAQNNYSLELDETRRVLNWARGQWEGRLNLIGHSRGGGIAVLAAGLRETSASAHVDRLATWASVSDFAQRFPSGGALENWRTTGRLDVLNGRTGQIMHLNHQHYENFQAHRSALDIAAAARAFKRPALVLHGSSDGAVTETNAHALASALPDSTLEIIDRAGHTFGAREPWTSSKLPLHLAQVTDRTIAFFKR